MTNLLTTHNKRNTYIVIDSNDNILQYFRLKVAAMRWVVENKKIYMDKLRVIKNV